MATKAKPGSMAARYKKSYETRDTGSGGNPAINFSKVGDVEFYEIKERNQLNIIPYVIKTKNHPLVASKDMEIGNLDYVLDIFIHRFVGGNATDVVCLRKNYNRPCPICEESDRLKADGDKDASKDLKPSRRVYYNVQDVTNPSKLMVLDTSHFLFEKELIEEARQGDDSGDIVDFADITEGKSVKFRASKEKFDGNDFFKPKTFTFIDRPKPLKSSLIDQALSFDELLVIRTYDEIQKLMYGDDADEDDEDDDPKPRKSKSSKATEEDDEDDVDDSDDDDDMDDDDSDEDDDSEDDSDDDDLDDEDDEDAPPKRKPRKV